MNALLDRRLCGQTRHSQCLDDGGIWYAARRYDVALPSPAFDLYHYDAPTVNQEAEVTPEKIAAMLHNVDTFAMLPENVVDMLAANGVYMKYALAEATVEAGQDQQGVSVIVQGHASMTLAHDDGVEYFIEQSRARRSFRRDGTIWSRRRAHTRLLPRKDVNVVIIDYANHHGESSIAIHNLPSGVNAFISRRRSTVERISSIESTETPSQSEIQTIGHITLPQERPMKRTLPLLLLISIVFLGGCESLPGTSNANERIAELLPEIRRCPIPMTALDERVEELNEAMLTTGFLEPQIIIEPATLVGGGDTLEEVISRVDYVVASTSTHQRWAI